jgi:hypothetical protein
VATFSFAKQGISENSPLNRTRGNIGARLKAIEVNRRYLTNLTTRLLASVRRVLLSFGMRFRTYKNADLTVSEVGFGLWTISTGWWGNFT